MRIFSPQKPL